jgi:hypothetical protein
MASGISSPWGQSMQNVAGLKPSLDMGKTHLTGELSLTSIPPTFSNDGSMVSPLMENQQNFYSTGFGKRKNKKNFLSRLRIVSKEITYLKN